MTLITAPMLGLEALQRSAFLTLFDNLNPSIAEISAYMVPQDTEFATRLGRNYVQVTTETIDASNFYEGHRPSLIEAPITQYPNCCVWSVRSSAAPESELLDQMSISRNLLYVEVMVKSNVDEEEVNKRILRTVEGVNLCFMRDTTLNGYVNSMGVEPTVNISDVFVRKANTTYGSSWLWQGARLEYTVQKETVMPSSSGMFNSGVPSDYSQFIDQG